MIETNISSKTAYTKADQVNSYSESHKADRTVEENEYLDFKRLIYHYEESANAEKQDDTTDEMKDAAQKENSNESASDKMTAEEAMDYLRVRSQEMKEKLLHGETEEKIKIGATECTASEWKDLIKRIDKVIDDVKEKVRDEEKRREEKELKKDIIEKIEREENLIESEEDECLDRPRVVQIF